MAIDINVPKAEDKENGFRQMYMGATNGSPVPGVNTNSYQPYNYWFFDKLGYQMGYIYNITGNCQIASLMYVESMLISSNYVNFFKWVYQQLAKDVLKAQFLIDIKDRNGNVEKIRELFAGHVVYEQAYTSTNNSNMVMLLVRSEALK